MYWWNYTREIILTVQGVEERFEIQDHSIKPVLFSILTGITSAVLMPAYAFTIISTPRREYIKKMATIIVRKQHRLANEK